MNRIWIPVATLHRHARKIERANMKKHHHSLTAGAIASRARVYEIRDNDIVVDENWKTLLNAEAR